MMVINEDVLQLFKDIDPIHLTLKDPNDIMLLFHATIEKMMGTPHEAMEFLKLAVEHAKSEGIDSCIETAREEISKSDLKRYTPSYIWPLLRVLITHSLDPDVRRKFDEYLKNKENKQL